jgi:hypothetical protein
VSGEHKIPSKIGEEEMCFSVGVGQQYDEEEGKAAKTGFTQWTTFSCEKKKCCFEGSRPFQGTRRDAEKKKRRDNVGAAKKRRIDNESMT